MALVIKDRVLETCTSPGTGSVTLLGASAGYQTFGTAIGDTNTTYYTIADQTGNNWEVGIGTYATAGNTLARTTVLASSNSGALVNFSSGTQNVFGDYPAGRAIYGDASNIIQAPSLNAEVYSTAAAITAGTNAQGQGPLVSDYNIVTTAAANPSGVTLPTATVGRRVIIVNKGANPIAVFPATGAIIDALAVNTSVTIPVAGWMEFDASSATQWYSTKNAMLPITSGLGTGILKNTTGTGVLSIAVAGTDYLSPTTPALVSETYSTTAAVTAGTNAQGQGALTTDFNVVTTAAANPSGVTLPTATVGRRVLINNRGANPIAVFPATGAQIDALGANLAFTIPVNSWMQFNASSTTQWYSSTVVASGTGTVTTVSVVTANGLAGTVATATTTPAITLSTTITGLLKGNGTAISAAVAGTDYLSPTAPALASETFSTTASVTAGTNAQGQGALTTDFNVITSAPNNPSGVTLPTATVGRRITVNNRGANPIAVYPAVGGTIDSLAINTPITVAANSWMEFNAASTTQWYSSTTGGGSGTVTGVSVASANGFSGTVATPNTTPNITLATTTSGILYGNAGALSSVTIGSGLAFAAGTLSATGGGGGSLGPMMSYTMTTTQSIPANSTTVVLLNSIDFDTTSAYSVATGRFTPTVAGYYQVNWAIAANGTVGEQTFQLWKNGAIYHWGIHFATSSFWCMSGGSLAIYLNGTTDYIDTRWYNNSGAIITVNPNNTVPGRFTATYIGPAPTSAGSGLYSGLLVTPPVLANWTQMNITAPATVGNSAVGPILTDQFGVGPRVRGLYKAAPTAPYTITAMVSAVSPAYNFAGFGIGFTDGTKIQMIANGFNNGSCLRILNFTSPTVFGSDATASQIWGFSIATLWYQIADDGTSVYFRQSSDGVNFNNVYSVTKSTGWLGSAGYTNVGFFLDVEGTAQGGAVQNCSLTLQSWKQV